MGESDRYSDFQRPRRRLTLGDDNNALMGLFVLNTIFFLLLLVIEVTYNFFQKDGQVFNAQVVQYFQLPAQLSKLADHPWSVLTYMFTEVRVLAFISNMLWLWAFGFILQELTGNKKLIPIYIYGGLLGAVFFIAANYIIPSLRFNIANNTLLGANASTMAIAVATTVLAPNFRFFRNIGGGIPIWVLTLIYVLIDLAGIATSSVAAAFSIAHLGGGLAGFLFVYMLRRGVDLGDWMHRFYNWFMNLFNPDRNKSKTTIREKVFYNADNRKPYKKTAHVTQQRVDEILDKINQKGYHFLTDEEKNILKRASEEDLS